MKPLNEKCRLRTEAKRLLRTEAKRLLRTEAKRLLRTEAKRLPRTEAKRLLRTEPKRLLRTEAKRLLRTEAKRLRTEAKRLRTEAIASAERTQPRWRTEPSAQMVTERFKCSRCSIMLVVSCCAVRAGKVLCDDWARRVGWMRLCSSARVSQIRAIRRQSLTCIRCEASFAGADWSILARRIGRNDGECGGLLRRPKGLGKAAASWSEMDFPMSDGRRIARVVDCVRVAWRRLDDHRRRHGISRTAARAVTWIAIRLRGRLVLLAGDGALGFALDPYRALLRVDAENPRRRSRLKAAERGLVRRPRFVVVTPVHNPPPGVLDAAIASVTGQSYPEWTLVLCDDGSTDPEVGRVVTRWQACDARIRVVRHEPALGIARATNAAAQAGADAGEWIVFLDHDDLLDRDALLHLAFEIARTPRADLVYSDEDKLDPSGERVAPALKPGWSPELLLSYCYLGHLTAVRASLFRELGGIRAGFEGAQDHDFWLRAGLRARAVAHVPRFLYHWRMHAGSTASGGRAKPRSFEAGARAVREALLERGADCTVERPQYAQQSGWGIYVPRFPEQGPRVAIVLHAPRGWAGFESTLDALALTHYHAFTLIIVENGLPAPGVARPLPFPVSRAGCTGTSQAEALDRVIRGSDAEIFVLLEPGLVPEDPAWLAQMVGWLGLPGVGAVAPRVVDGRGRLVHAGFVHGFEPHLITPFGAGLERDEPGPMFLACVTGNRTLIGVQGLMMHKETYLESGGFDPALGGALYAFDLCWRLEERQQRRVVAGEVHLVVSSVAQGDRPPAAELAIYRGRHGHRRDPLHNPRLERGGGLELAPTIMPVAAGGEPIRLLAVTHNLNWEGAPLMQRELLEGLVARGVVDPVVLAAEDGPLREEYERAGIPVVVDAEPERALGDLASALDLELVHANTIPMHAVIAAAAELGLPSVWSIHESEPIRHFVARLPGLSIGRMRSRLAAPYRVVYTAQASLGAHRGFETAANFTLVHARGNPARMEARLAALDQAAAREMLGIEASAFVVLIMGTVGDRKGQHDLLHAFARLAPAIARRTTCLVVGYRESIPYGRELLRLAADLPPDRRDHFRIVAESSDPALYYRAADLFVCCSRVESYPRVIIEAMQAGLPIVTTPVFGIMEQVREHKNALFYDPGDAQALADRIAELAADPRARAALALESRAIFASLPTYEVMIEGYARIFLAARESALPQTRRDGGGEAGLPHFFRASRRARSRAGSRF